MSYGQYRRYTEICSLCGKEHPEAVNEYYTGGAARCPCSWGYEEKQACKQKPNKGMSCRECWSREMEDGK